MFDETGRFVGYRGVGRHITERRRAEEALRAMQAMMKMQKIVIADLDKAFAG